MQLHPDDEYKCLVETVLQNGSLRKTRNGDVISLFAPPSLRFKVSHDAFPVLTTKFVHFTSVKEELLWFLKGSTNAKELSQRGVKIWDANAAENGELGPVYGHQWRHFGQDLDKGVEGIDQIQLLIDGLKRDPFGRRHIVSAWNPLDTEKMALPPCHILSQWYVRSDGTTLDCQLYQRSGDIGLGVPFNISSYSLLMCMVAQVCGYTPGTLTHILGDAHIYVDHIGALKEQLGRHPKPLPHLTLSKKTNNIFEFESKDIDLCEYQYHPKLPMEMKA